MLWDDDFPVHDGFVQARSQSATEFVKTCSEPRSLTVAVLFPSWIFVAKSYCGGTANQRDGDGGNCDQQAQLMRESQTGILDVQPLGLAIGKQAFDEPPPAVVAQDAGATVRFGRGHDEQFTSFDPPGAEVEFKVGDLLWRAGRR